MGDENKAPPCFDVNLLKERRHEGVGKVEYAYEKPQLEGRGIYHVPSSFFVKINGRKINKSLKVLVKEHASMVCTVKIAELAQVSKATSSKKSIKRSVLDGDTYECTIKEEKKVHDRVPLPIEVSKIEASLIFSCAGLHKGDDDLINDEKSLSKGRWGVMEIENLDEAIMENHTLELKHSIEEKHVHIVATKMKKIEYFNIHMSKCMMKNTTRGWEI